MKKTELQELASEQGIEWSQDWTKSDLEAALAEADGDEPEKQASAEQPKQEPSSGGKVKVYNPGKATLFCGGLKVEPGETVDASGLDEDSQKRLSRALELKLLYEK